ncbi:unnamed protein product [uncultured bacterium]|nr:unnamed protein product [uncultured bacterium]
MGHVRTGPLPRTRKWVRVVGLVTGGAGAPQVATATLNAADQAFARAANDVGVVEAVWLLMQLPLAARSDDFAAALHGCGLDVSDSPGLLEVVGATADAIDARMPNCKGRTDLGEMAQTAATETLTRVVGGRLNGLFGTGPQEVRAEFARLATPKQFGILARDFFAGFVNKCLGYHLSKALPEQVGEGKRFRTLAQHAEFTRALDQHCREAAVRVEEYAGDWFSKHNWQTGGQISRADVAAFTAYAMTKLTGELRRGAADGP